jgi:hypothetical protein
LYRPSKFDDFVGVSPEQYEQIDKERERCKRRFRFRHYDYRSRNLLITIPTFHHERLHSVLYTIYLGEVSKRGLWKQWATLGSPTMRTAGNHSGRESGEGDSTGGPDPERTLSDHWPTLVVEAGFSQSLAQLQLVMRWWFRASDHQVKIVLLSKLNRLRDAIILQRWEEAPFPRPGATTTRQAATLQPLLRQEITITRDTSSDPPSFNVAKGALVLDFRLLFLRAPDLEEGDFVIGVEDLREYAAKVLNVP